MLKRNQQMHKTLLVLVLFGFISGCSINPMALSEVSGRVTLDKVPVKGATVIFVPKKVLDHFNRKLPLSYGITNEKGEYKLKRLGAGSGAAVGEHFVLIKKPREPNAAELAIEPDAGEESTSTPEISAELAEEIERLMESVSSELNPFVADDDNELIPEFYNKQSILDFQVVAGKNENADFDLSTVDPLLKK